MPAWLVLEQGYKVDFLSSIDGTVGTLSNCYGDCGLLSSIWHLKFACGDCFLFCHCKMRRKPELICSVVQNSSSLELCLGFDSFVSHLVFYADRTTICIHFALLVFRFHVFLQICSASNFLSSSPWLCLFLALCQKIILSQEAVGRENRNYRRLCWAIARISQE